MKLYRNKSGEKLYPVCSWEKNQHKLYNALDRINNALYDAQEDPNVTELEWDKLLDRKEQIEHALEMFDRYVVEGIVYATYTDGVLIKDIVWAYNARR